MINVNLQSRLQSQVSVNIQTSPWAAKLGFCLHWTRTTTAARSSAPEKVDSIDLQGFTNPI